MMFGILLAARLAFGADPPNPCLAALARAEAVMASTTGYTATFHKQERVGGKLRSEQVAVLKFRKPFSVYLKWLAGPYRGGEAMFVRGRDRDRMRVHSGGLLSFLHLSLDPLGGLAMRGNRHPVTQIGLDLLLATIGEAARKAQAAGTLRCDPPGTATLFGRTVTVVTFAFPPGPDDPDGAARVEASVDRGTSALVQARIFGADGALVEAYGYADLVLNAGLTDADFDPANPRYGF